MSPEIVSAAPSPMASLRRCCIQCLSDLQRATQPHAAISAGLRRDRDARVWNRAKAMLLTVAALGMFTYGAYEIGWAVVDLIRGARLELRAELGVMAFGLLLVLAAAF